MQHVQYRNSTWNKLIIVFQKSSPSPTVGHYNCILQVCKFWTTVEKCWSNWKDCGGEYK